MDQSLLVSVGQQLLQLLDNTKVRPRFAMWVNFSDTESWKLWIVPAKGLEDKREFYMVVADAVSHNRDLLPNLDIGMIELVSETKPIIKAMRTFIHMPGIGSANLSGNRFNGVFLPEGILLRSDL